MEQFLQFTLALIMFSVGLSLRWSDFRYLRSEPTLLATGLAAKMILMPLIGWGLLLCSQLPVSLQMGTLLLLITPGGTTSNIITYYARGTAALTIMLTSIATILAVFTIPLFYNLISRFYLNTGTQITLSFTQLAGQLLLVIILPSLLGLLMRAYYPERASTIERILKPLAVGLLGIVYLVKFLFPTSSATALTATDFYQLMPVLLLINIVGLIGGWFFARLFGYGWRPSMTIGVEMGIQNPGLVLFIAISLLDQEALIRPALLYALFSFWTTAIFAFLVNRNFSVLLKE